MARSDPRRPSRKAGQTIIAGIAWYDSVQWTKLKQVAADSDELDDSHEQWQQNAERTERNLAAEGIVVRRVPIDIDALVAWCQTQNKSVDGSARVEYTNFMLRSEMSS